MTATESTPNVLLLGLAAIWESTAESLDGLIEGALTEDAETDVGKIVTSRDVHRAVARHLRSVVAK